MNFIQAFRLPSDPIYHCTLFCIPCFQEINKYCLNQIQGNIDEITCIFHSKSVIFSSEKNFPCNSTVLLQNFKRL